MTHSKLYTLLCASLLTAAAVQLSAQTTEPAAAEAPTPSLRHQRWEIGLQAGAAQAQTDVSNLGVEAALNLSGGLLVRYHLDDNFALRANVLYAELTGDDTDYTKHTDRGFRFSAPLTEGSLMFEVDLLGKRRWAGNKFHRQISPYGFAGVGYALTSPTTFYNETENEAIRSQIDVDKAEQHDGFVVLPMGAGVKLDLNENWVMGLEAGVRVIFNDYLDGISQAANPRRNDTYGLLSLSATYRFPYVTDRDHDGVPDEDDPCPDQAGPKDTNGCPDSDNDGILDNRDGCPDQAGPKATNGCPDGDNDGISDKNDACPTEKGPRSTGGCPDKDLDGVADKNDACPDLAGLARFQGCPDTDGDGIPDKDDQCPQQRGTADRNGCPANDRDRDGVLDEVDTCPDTPGLAQFSGCPDSDSDGVTDAQDRCPTQAGPAANSGCPELTAADQEVLKAAVYGVQFESGKSTIKAGSTAILDQVADVMSRYPAYHLTISGHTDSAGKDATNQRLSENRALACFQYLAGKGVAAERMTSQGFGETRPVADNATADGKAKNRRVEFELKVK